MWTLSYEIVFLFEFLKIYSDHMLKCHNFEIQWWWCIQVVILFHQVRIAWWIRWVIIINKNHPQLQVEQLKINDEENEKSKFNWLLLIYVNFTRSCLEIRMFYFVFVSLFLFLHDRCFKFSSSLSFWLWISMSSSVCIYCFFVFYYRSLCFHFIKIFFFLLSCIYLLCLLHIVVFIRWIFFCCFFFFHYSSFSFFGYLLLSSCGFVFFYCPWHTWNLEFCSSLNRNDEHMCELRMTMMMARFSTREMIYVLFCFVFLRKINFTGNIL